MPKLIPLSISTELFQLISVSSFVFDHFSQLNFSSHYLCAVVTDHEIWLTPDYETFSKNLQKFHGRIVSSHFQVNSPCIYASENDPMMFHVLISITTDSNHKWPKVIT